MDSLSGIAAVSALDTLSFRVIKLSKEFRDQVVDVDYITHVTSVLEALLDGLQRNNLLLSRKSGLSESDQELLRLRDETVTIGYELLKSLLESRKRKWNKLKGPNFTSQRTRTLAQQLQLKGILIEDHIVKNFR